MRSFTIGLTLLPGLLLAQDPGLQLTEWTVPWPESRPRDPAVAPDGRVWFVGQAGNYVAVFDPVKGEFKRYEIDPGTNPHNVIVAKDGMVWYSGNQNGMIGKLNPADGSITRYPLPDKTLGDPHTLAFDSKGDIWFTVQAGNAVGKLTTSDGKFRIVPMPATASRPYGIAIDSKNRPWFDEFGANRIGTVHPVSFKLTEYTISNPSARPRRIVITPDDKIFVGDYARGMLVRLDPVTGKISEWANPSGANSGPYAMAGDNNGRVWQVETGPQPNRFVSFDPKSEKFGTPVPIAKSGGLVVRHMVFDPKSRSIWFGTDANTIGRAEVGPAGAGKPTP